VTCPTDVEFGVRIYNLVQEAKKSSFVWLESARGAPVKISSKNVCADTASLLLPSQIKLAYTYGGHRVFFEKSELNDIKVLDKPCIRLMGFKPKSHLKDHYNIKHSSFIYPDEQAIKGSTVTFSALWNRMIAMDKVAICKMTPRASSPSRFVALIAQEEKRDKTGEQVVAPGMHVIWLPFVDDIRSLQFDEMKQPSEEQVQAAQRLVKALRIRFDSNNFPNPVLQKHYKHLQALALNREADEVEEPEDLIVPDFDGMDSRLDSIKPFAQSVFPPHYAPDPKKTPSKSKATSSAKKSKKRARDDDDDDDDDGLMETPTKKRKTAADPSAHNWAALVRTGGIKKITIPDLKAYLASKGIKGVSGKKKDELVEMVCDAVNSDS
jgi:ATP-dependent DNA helicase 2 subunit 1